MSLEDGWRESSSASTSGIIPNLHPMYDSSRPTWIELVLSCGMPSDTSLCLGGLPLCYLHINRTPLLWALGSMTCSTLEGLISPVWNHHKCHSFFCIFHGQGKTQALGAGRICQWLRAHQLLFQRTQVTFPAPTRQLTTISNSISRGTNSLLLISTDNACMQCRQTFKQTLIYVK